MGRVEHRCRKRHGDTGARHARGRPLGLCDSVLGQPLLIISKSSGQRYLFVFNLAKFSLWCRHSHSSERQSRENPPTSFRLWFGNTRPVGQTPCF